MEMTIILDKLNDSHRYANNSNNRKDELDSCSVWPRRAASQVMKALC